ncbi:hypothetical protein K435DRAFT_777991 [Dendrothele bispora CBS 962.96]|uniref:DUF6699 domain-containing protein n=1 Tax=Dendrothele bispora (strain CBS 962.96) TaxID=1314807 RepID=A0A4V4HG60_DENBC|nr:hypothetical protein K435DRAFT_777991 [Dendrothele bispora CBS 962.96]
MVHLPGFRDILNRFHSPSTTNHFDDYQHHQRSHHHHHGHHHSHHHSRSGSSSRTPVPTSTHAAPAVATIVVPPTRPRSTPPVPVHHASYARQKQHHYHRQVVPIYVTPSPLLNDTVPIGEEGFPIPASHAYYVDQPYRSRAESFSGSGRHSLDHGANVGPTALHPDPSSSSSHNASTGHSSNSHSHSHSSSSNHVSRGSSSTSISQHPQRPALKRSNTGAGTSSQGHSSLNSSDQDIQKRRRHVSFVNPKRPVTLHMHPLLASNAHTHAPISYDVIFPPSRETVVDRTTLSSVPSHLLKEPATEPSTIDRLLLKSEWLPDEWGVLATPGGRSSMIDSPHSTNKKFFIGEFGPVGADSSSTGITNFDVLYAVYVTLQQKITREEWDELGRSDHGPRGQRHAVKAYERRCRLLGGGWDEGVKRVDWLGERTKLSGVVADKNENPLGKANLVFSRAG